MKPRLFCKISLLLVLLVTAACGTQEAPPRVVETEVGFIAESRVVIQSVLTARGMTLNEGPSLNLVAGAVQPIQVEAPHLGVTLNFDANFSENVPVAGKVLVATFKVDPGGEWYTFVLGEIESVNADGSFVFKQLIVQGPDNALPGRPSDLNLKFD